MTTPRRDLLAYTLPELIDLLAGYGQPAFRAKQIYRQLYVNLVDDIQQMTDLPLALRSELAQHHAIGSLTYVRTVSADNQMTHKALFQLPTGEQIESVLMLYPDRPKQAVRWAVPFVRPADWGCCATLRAITSLNK
jgi:23S rRNA (adenine2503-C2)-methyltransferase